MSIFFRRGRGLLHRRGEERATAIRGDAASVLDDSYHAVELYVAAREYEQHVAGAHVRILNAEAHDRGVAVRLLKGLELERVGVDDERLRVVGVGRSLLRHLMNTSRALKIVWMKRSSV